MNSRGTFKSKSQISNYLYIQKKNKQKNNSNSTSNNTILSEKDNNNNKITVDSFRKGSVRQNGSALNKFKTGKNSPDHFLFKQEHPKNLRSLSGKHRDLNEDQNMEIKSILTNSKIRKMLKESIGFDGMFRRKMKMILNKNTKNEKSQMTYSNIYSHNSTKGRVDNSFYQKASKNESFAKKTTHLFEYANLFNKANCSNNNSNKVINNSKAKNSYEQDKSGDNNNDSHTTKMKSDNKTNQPYQHQNNHHQDELKLNNNNDDNANKNLGVSNYIDIYFGNGYSNSSTGLYKNKHMPNQSGSYSNSNSNSNSIQNAKKQNSLISKSNILENNFVNANKPSNSDLLDQKNKNSSTKGSPSKNNLRKNSIDITSQVYYHNGDNPSSTLKMFNYQKSIKEKSNIDNNENEKRASASSLKQKYEKYSQEIKPNDKSHHISNTNNNTSAGNANQKEAKSNLMNIANSITPSPRITAKRLPTSFQVFNNNNHCIQNVQTPNTVIQSSTKSHTNMSDIKFNEYVISHYKNSNNNSMKNSTSSIKKNNESVKDIFLAKLKANQKQTKSLTTVQSKLNSKSNSRVEEFFNIPLANKPNDDLFNFSIVKKSSDKMPGKKLLENTKSSIPISMCQSPIGKSPYGILEKFHKEKKPELELELEIAEEKEKEVKKLTLKNGFEVVKKSLESTDLLMNNYNIKSNGAEIEQMVNETSESIQSTTREGAFYRRERDKLSNYIKQYYNENRVYPPSEIQFYRCGRLIGRGAFGKVNLGLHVCSGRLVAMKSFNLAKNTSKHSKSKIKNEVDMLTELQHPFISQILDTFETDKHIVIVMEYICGDLFSFIRKRSKLSEAFSKVIFKQIIEGLRHIHRHQIVHRDIKLDNILIDLNNTVKICDFGVSRKVIPGTIMHDHCGTPAYIAPEIFLKQGYQGYSCDIWSAGVTLYYMLSGSQPFKANNLHDLHSVIIAGKYNKIESISPEGRDLIEGMLQVDPKKRMTISQILSHPWVVSVDIKNRSNLNLFTTAEKVLLAKHNIDYLNSNKENIIEQFTSKNLDTLKEEEMMNGNTNSVILAPFNSVVNLNDSSFSSDIQIENDIWKFCGKVKQLNVKYELNNNKQFDNGIIITQPELINQKKKEREKDNMTSSSGKYSSSKPISPLVELEDAEDDMSLVGHKDIICKIDEEESLNENDAINDNIVIDIEKNIGYKRSYLLDCLHKKEVNYSTGAYHLLNQSNSK